MNRTQARRAFTLIELLVVISIILLLVGLLAAGVSRAIVKGQEARNRNDIMQLEMAVQAFKTQYGFYPPSMLMLAPRGPIAYPNNALGNDSQYYLGTMFPRIWTNFQTNPNFFLNWAGDNNANRPVDVLMGDQCLVFFLGGVKDSTGSLNGFSTDPRDPTRGSQRTPSFYEFQLGRLALLNSQTPGSFPSYLDVYGKQPYLYFSANKQPNGYVDAVGAFRYGRVDCDPLPKGPYIQKPEQPATPTTPYVPPVFWKPNSFQIISAGRDKAFGPGRELYTAGDISLNAANISPDGQDNQTNFAAGVLGGGQ